MSNKTNAIDDAYRKAREQDGSIVYGVKKGTYLGDMVDKHTKDKQARLKEYRAEARRKVSLANKRVRRLEEKGLTNSPAYQALVRSGSVRFSVKGKDFNQLQSEVSRMDRFIKANTSTVRGIINHTKELAKITKFEYESVANLKEELDIFFELSNKIEQYLREVHDIASAIGYNKIWQAVNTYIQANKIDLTDSKTSIEELINTIAKAIAEKETPEYILSNADQNGNRQGGRFQLLD